MDITDFKDSKNFDSIEFSKFIFGEIIKANDILEIINLIHSFESIFKIKFDLEKYPKLNFTISSAEITTLENLDILNTNGALNIENPKFIEKLSDPLFKLLFAMAWKQGDLIKVSHIVNGILNKKENEYENKPIVFYQFGKHLGNPASEPIVDQHVLRAFSYFKNGVEPKKINLDLVNIYKEWLQSNLSKKIQKCDNYLYHIDILVFLTGKVIKNHQVTKTTKIKE